ncbi:helix-turn-helix domain-containing protein [Bacillaceae bacterium Marseille-Q3522]|nr:helix-turn-helix domain-containing protein [Bacillaceae bacterium Marseille-Q3522]
MYQLSKEQAQDIVDKMMKDIPYNINIMNEHGVIIGSGNKKRVGTVHDGAVKALKTGKMIEVYEDTRYAKKGTNEPIVIDHKRVGVIGISGKPEEVRPFCSIVKTTVSLLAEQGIALKNLENESKKKKAFLEILFQRKPPYSEKLIKEAADYKLDLYRKTTVVFIKNLLLNDEHAKILLKYPCFNLEENTYIIMIQNPSEVSPAMNALISEKNKVVTSIGDHISNIAHSYYQAKRSMAVIEDLSLPCRIITYEDAAFFVKLGEISLMEEKTEETMMEGLNRKTELLMTLKSYIANNCNTSVTARQLNIHRNTLQYRLEKIREVTGKDPRKILELFELTHILLRSADFNMGTASM